MHGRDLFGWRWMHRISQPFRPQLWNTPANAHTLELLALSEGEPILDRIPEEIEAARDAGLDPNSCLLKAATIVQEHGSSPMDGDQLDAAQDRLDPHQRALLAMSKSGMTYRQIAAVINSDPADVADVLASIYARLRNHLLGCHIDDFSLPQKFTFQVIDALRRKALVNAEARRAMAIVEEATAARHACRIAATASAAPAISAAGPASSSDAK